MSRRFCGKSCKVHRKKDSKFKILACIFKYVLRILLIKRDKIPKVEVHVEVEVASGSLIIYIKWVFSCGSCYFEPSTLLEIEVFCDSLGSTYLVLD